MTLNFLSGSILSSLKLISVLSWDLMRLRFYLPDLNTKILALIQNKFSFFSKYEDKQNSLGQEVKK